MQNEQSVCENPRYAIGRPHPDRARQFKPFTALRGYEELVDKARERVEKDGMANLLFDNRNAGLK